MKLLLITLLGLFTATTALANEVVRFQAGLGFDTEYADCQAPASSCGSGISYVPVSIELIAEDAWSLPRGSYVFKETQEGYDFEATIHIADYGSDFPGGRYWIMAMMKWHKHGDDKHVKFTRMGNLHLKTIDVIPGVDWTGEPVPVKKGQTIAPILGLLAL
jgi:hypothetical protein